MGDPCVIRKRPPSDSDTMPSIRGAIRFAAFPLIEFECSALDAANLKMHEGNFSKFSARHLGLVSYSSL